MTIVWRRSVQQATRYKIPQTSSSLVTYHKSQIIKFVQPSGPGGSKDKPGRHQLDAAVDAVAVGHLEGLRRLPPLPVRLPPLQQVVGAGCRFSGTEGMVSPKPPAQGRVDNSPRFLWLLREVGRGKEYVLECRQIP